METLYQSLVAVEPLTLIATICNLFVQMFIIKKFFLDKILAVLDQRRQAADKQISEAQTARQEAMDIKKNYEQNMLQATQQANEILVNAQKTAAERSEKIISSKPLKSRAKPLPTLPWRRKRPSTTPKTKSPALPWPLPARLWSVSWVTRINPVSLTASLTNWVIRYDPDWKRIWRGSL